jgi:Flp pilus assembly protein TadD
MDLEFVRVMCRPRALAATAVLLLAVSGPAHAWPFGKKGAAAEAKPAAAPAPAAPAPVPGSWNRPAAPAATPASDARPAEPPRRATPEERATAKRLDPLAQSAFWSREFEIDPKDTEAGVNLAAALRRLGQHEEAAGAAERVLLVSPGLLDAQLEVARARIAGNKAFYALEPLKAAMAAHPNDWRVHSLRAVALEQTRRLPEARAAWGEALRLSPENPQVLTNLALSYVAEGDAAQAETLLRRAAVRPDADIRVRQNLALVLGLRGRTAEAEQLLREDLPPDQADKALAWLKARSGAGPRTWGALQSAN